MLRGLRGDFLCSPLGESDLTLEESRPHGTTTNTVWHNTRRSADTLEFVLETMALGVDVSKRVHLNSGEAVGYQEHIFAGGAGRLPLGHHATLRVSPNEALELSFSRRVWGGTPPTLSKPSRSGDARACVICNASRT